MVSTFKQTLDLARAGNIDEATVGCDFILKLDPQFQPATRLAEKLRNPFANVNLDELEAEFSQEDPLSGAREAMAERDFNRALTISSEVLRADLMNVEAQQIAEEAQSRLEAEPFIAQFVKSGQNKLDQGNRNSAAIDLEKARQLDPSHPLVRSFEARMEGAAAPQPPAASADAPLDFGGGFASPFGSGFGETPTVDPFASTAPSPSFVSPAPETPSFSFQPPPAPAVAPPAEGGFGFGNPPSFVVDATPGTGAPATDFGFTFEEEQRHEPAASTSSPFASTPFAREEANTFDFAMASVETTAEDRNKVEKYLAEGDAAYESGDFQHAIDTWSKIFLIDVTNDDASQRIERARARRQETDRKIEDLTVAGTLAFDKNDRVTARQKFEQILTLDPNNFNAREYLDRIEEGSSGSAPAAAPSRPPNPANAYPLDTFDDDFSGAPGPAGATIAPLVPPDPSQLAGASKAKATPTATKKAPAKSMPIMPLALVAGLLILAAGGYFAYTKFAGTSAAVNPAETRETFVKATRLGKNHRYDEAIALLSAIKPQDPEHDRALEMIDDLKNQKAQSSGLINGRPAAEVFAGLIQKGRDAFAGHDYLTAKQALEQASTIQPLPAEVKQIADSAGQQVAKLDTALVLLKEGKYPDGIANLEGLQQQDPQNATVRQLLGRAHFNLGVAALQQDSTETAIAEFDHVLQLEPQDEEAKRSRDLAAKYNGQANKDLMYKIYVKYLPPRPF